MPRPASPEARLVRRRVALAAALALAGAGCFLSHPTVTQSAGPIITTSQPVPSSDRVMRVTLMPTVREIRVLKTVAHDAPKEGLALRAGAPVTLHVSASGTGNLHGAAWLEGPSGPVGRTTLAYDAAADSYTGTIRIEPGQLAAGDYDVKAVLEADGKEVTDVVTAVDPVRLSLEGLPADLKAQIEAWSAFFDTDSAVMSPDDQRAAQDLIARIQPFAPHLRTIRVVGHCDTRGTEVHNASLGGNRAAALARLLSGSLPGVAVGIESAGSADPNPAGDSPESWAKNRWARLVLEAK